LGETFKRLAETDILEAGGKLQEMEKWRFYLGLLEGKSRVSRKKLQVEVPPGKGTIGKKKK